MKKSKLLAPLVGLGAIAAAITPIATLTSCNGRQVSTDKVLPIEAFIVDADGILRGFNPKFKITGNYDTMSFNDNVGPTITGVGVAAFYNPMTGKTTIPANIKCLKFADTYDGNDIAKGPTETIGDYAFYGSPFKRVQLSYGIKTIGRFAFSHSQVESCNFPGGLNEIKEEAFSYSNLCSAMFANDVLQHDGPAIPRAPWMWQNMVRISSANCVQHVRPKAFYNCKNLVAHRITPYAGAYELDENGNGPFTIYDEVQHKDVGSNIKILDYSCCLRGIEEQQSEGLELPKNPQTIFGVHMDPTHSQTISTDKFIICHDLPTLKPDWAEQIRYLNMIAVTFSTQTYSPSLTSMPLTMGDWTILGQSQANYVFDMGYPDLTKPIDLGGIAYYDSAITPLPYFMQQNIPFFFPGDTQVEINNVSTDGVEDVSSHVHAEVYLNEDNLHYLRISMDKPGSVLGITYMDISLTFWSKYGFSYTYGPHYVWNENEGKYKLDIDNHIHVNVV